MPNDLYQRLMYFSTPNIGKSKVIEALQAQSRVDRGVKAHTVLELDYAGIERRIIERVIDGSLGYTLKNVIHDEYVYEREPVPPIEVAKEEPPAPKHWQTLNRYWGKKR